MKKSLGHVPFLRTSQKSTVGLRSQLSVKVTLSTGGIGSLHESATNESTEEGLGGWVSSTCTSCTDSVKALLGPLDWRNTFMISHELAQEPWTRNWR